MRINYHVVLSAKSISLLGGFNFIYNHRRRRRGRPTETKNHTFKCWKWHYCAINENCCSVDWGRTIPGGRGICPLPSSPPRGIWQRKCPHPWEFAIQERKNANARGGHGNWPMHNNFLRTAYRGYSVVNRPLNHWKYTKSYRLIGY